MGTPNLSGTYTGSGGIVIRASSPADIYGQTLAASDCCQDWEWFFDGCNGELIAPKAFLTGKLYPSANAPAGIVTCVDYTISGPGGAATIPVIDNCDGTYTVCYRWTISAGMMTLQKDTNIRLEITELRNCATPPPSPFTKLSIVTWPQGYSSIPGTPLPSDYSGTFPPTQPGYFFNHATPDWRGCAES